MYVRSRLMESLRFASSIEPELEVFNCTKSVDGGAFSTFCPLKLSGVVTMKRSRQYLQ
jgi:hypothetical protein